MNVKPRNNPYELNLHKFSIFWFSELSVVGIEDKFWNSWGIIVQNMEYNQFLQPNHKLYEHIFIDFALYFTPRDIWALLIRFLSILNAYGMTNIPQLKSYSIIAIMFSHFYRKNHINNVGKSIVKLKEGKISPCMPQL